MMMLLVIMILGAMVMASKGFEEISHETKIVKESQKSPPPHHHQCHHHPHGHHHHCPHGQHHHHHHTQDIWLRMVSLCLFILASPPYLGSPHKHVYLVIKTILPCHDDKEDSINHRQSVFLVCLFL